MIWIIIANEKVGGAEKRFTGIWEGLVKQAGYSELVKLVIPPPLYKIFADSSEFAGSFKKYRESILVHDFSYSGGALLLRKNLSDFVYTYTSDGDTVHFIDAHPLKSFKNRQVVFSVTQSSLRNLSIKGKAAQLMAVLYSHKTDVLDPGIYRFVKRLFFLKGKSVTQTPGSFCNTDIFKPVKAVDKQNWIVFTGRLEPVKQIINFVKAIPAIYEAINGKEKGFKFYIIGWGSLKTSIDDILKTDAYRDIPVIFEYMENVHEVMNRAKYFVSLQLHNNYPSKSLIEAMSAGAIPVVTDTGQTRWLVKDEFGFFVKEHFTTADLAKTFDRITRLPDADLEKRSQRARTFVLENYSINNSISYFIRLYHMR
jgi:glycosyltransferase involved in cell wall biosynthesis